MPTSEPAVTDLAKARAYYKDFLGFEEAFTLKNPDGSDHIAFIKINDHQFIELLLEPPKNHGFHAHCHSHRSSRHSHPRSLPADSAT